MLALCKSSNWNTSKHWIARLNSSSLNWIYVYIDGRKAKLCKITATHTSTSINRIPMHAKIKILFFIPFLILPNIQDHWTNTKGFSPFVRYDVQFYFWLLWFLFLYRYSSFVCSMSPFFCFILTVSICLATIACDKRKLKLILFILFGHSTPGVLRQYANNRQIIGKNVKEFIHKLLWFHDARHFFFHQNFQHKAGVLSFRMER